jgi:lipid A 3-O-deacylase
MKKSATFIIIIFALITHSFAQGLSFFRIQESNDIVAGNNQDRYFTQGLKFELMSTKIGEIYQKSGIMSILPKLKHDSTSLNHASISFTQDFYTPDDKKADTVIVSDRPYAGAMYITFRNVSVGQNSKQRLTSDLDIGVLGPWALGKEMQNGVHLLFADKNGDTDIQGWNYQLNNDLYLNYTLKYERQLVWTKYMEMSSVYQFNVGTIYDDFGIGARLRLGIYKSHYDKYLGFINKKDRNRTVKSFFKGIQVYGFFNPVAKFVLYNALLQGGVINNINQTPEHRLSENRISRIIVDGNYGITIVTGRFSIQFIQYFKSREFDSGFNHRYGNILLTYSW